MSTKPKTVGDLLNRPMSVESRQRLEEAVRIIGTPSLDAIRKRAKRRGLRVITRANDLEYGPYLVVDPGLSNAIVASGLDMIGLQNYFFDPRLDGKD